MQEEKALESESSEVEVWLCVLRALWPFTSNNVISYGYCKNKMKWHGETDWALEPEWSSDFIC